MHAVAASGSTSPLPPPSPSAKPIPKSTPSSASASRAVSKKRRSPSFSASPPPAKSASVPLSAPANVSADTHCAPYEAINIAFAKCVTEVHRPSDLIWIHDYHLLLVPSPLRETLPDAAVGLFVHTPFPSSKVFRCLPRRKEIPDGMLGANLICFQTYSYSRHFTSSCIRVCGYEVTSQGGIDVQGHVAAIRYCPVGADADRVAKDT